jgi:hypothetical protein
LVLLHGDVVAGGRRAPWVGIVRLAQTVLDLDRQLTALIVRWPILRTHDDAATITSPTGIGDVLGAEFLAVVGGSLAGLPLPTTSPVTQASHPRARLGYCTGNLHRPQRYNRQLQRVFYTSAMISIQRSPASKAHYDGRRAHGKWHTQAVLALTRRRVNMLWAMPRDRRPYQEQPPSDVLAA